MRNDGMWKSIGALGVLGIVTIGCSEPQVAARADEAHLTETKLADLVANDPTLAAIKALATADIERYELTFGEDVGVPEPSAATGVQLSSGFRVRGLDWFRTPNATYPNNKSWDQGSDTGKKCQWAAVFRFEAIFGEPPAQALTMVDESTWSGAMWGWMDDHAATDRTADPKAAYAWSDSLWKWINASGAGDTCRTPTRSMVVGMMETCLDHARANGGRAKGCRMPTRSSVCTDVDARAQACLDGSCSLDPPMTAALSACCEDGLASLGCASLVNEEPNQDSCVEVCGEIGRAPGGCWCDRTCAESADLEADGCCTDYEEICR